MKIELVELKADPNCSKCHGTGFLPQRIDQPKAWSKTTEVLEPPLVCKCMRETTESVVVKER